jgi:hypothetical protein
MAATDEARKIVELGDELERAFPQVPVDKVRARVQEAWMKYLPARCATSFPCWSGGRSTTG